MAQDVQVVGKSAPSKFEDVPAKHTTQFNSVDDPRISEYLPGAQFVQVSGFSAPISPEYFPASHCRQMTTDTAANASLYVPRGHRLQIELPRMDLNLPGTHALHSAPSTPVYPLAQIHAVTSLLPSGDDVVGGQERQNDICVFAI
jgi:hypothetical protein